MNGFTNAILSLLLSWIRVFINQIWRLLSSDSSNFFFDFLSENWIALLVILCVGGFVIDRVIYFFRWRPYYVWLSRRRQRREEAVQEEAVQQAPATPEWDEFGNIHATVAHNSMSLPQAPPPSPVPAFPLQQPTAAYQRPNQQPSFSDNGATQHYAPMARATPFVPSPYAQASMQSGELSPVFDDDLGGWEQGDALLRQSNKEIGNLAGDMDDSFGAAKPEPIDYIRDMQAGFARPLPPEQLYQPSRTFIPPEEPAQQGSSAPVHPGLDMANFRRHIGLSPMQPPPAMNSQFPSEAAPPQTEAAVGVQPDGEENAALPTFAASRNIFSDTAQLQPARAHHPFASLAKRARGFVGVVDDEDQRSIHDLQPPVDLRSAFHAPVFPKPRTSKEDDDLSTY